MSSLLEKVKDKLHSHSDNKTEQPEGTHGTHSSRVANAADPRVDSDRDHREALGRHDGSYTTGGDNYSYGESNTKGMSTAGDTLTSSRATGPAPTTAGMHKSDMLNKADPRIDSDLDGSKNMGLRSEKVTHAGTSSTIQGTGTTGTAYGTDATTTGSSTGTSGTGTAFGSTGPASKTAGTHKSDIMNQADPRIDSDLDGSRNMGLRSDKATHDLGSTGTAGTLGATTGTGFGTGMGTDTLGAGSGIDTTGTSGAYTSGTSGLDTTTGRGSGTDTYGTGKISGLGSDTGAYSGTDTISGYGSGERNLGQQTGTLGSDTTTSAYGGMDTVGSGFGSGRQATGPASNTAGPHKSDMMNKADPRVDSDLDNSKTFGGDKTYRS